MAKLWLGYHRISRVGDRVDTAISDDEYRNKVEAFARRNGIEVELLPVERDQTGSKMDRPILDGALRLIDGGERAGLIVVRYNRLSRATVSDTHLTVDRIEAAGGQVRAVEEDFPDTPEGRMARNMSFGVSRMEWERSAAFIRAAKRRAVDAGIWPMSSVPIGYTVKRRKEGGDGKLTPTAKRKTVVRAFEARARGESKREVGLILGVGGSTAAKVIANPVYLGEIHLRADGETWINREAHEPLVTRDVWEAAQLDHPRPARGVNGPALLASIVRCAGCQGTMTPGDDGKGLRVYRCMPHKANGRCQAPAMISQRKLDTYVEAIALPHAEVLRFRAARRTDELGEIEVRLAKAEVERDLYQQVTSITEKGAGEFLAGARSRQAEVDRIRLELGAARAQLGAEVKLPAGASIGDLYETWPVETRRHLLRGSLGVVWVRRGRGACDERVRLIARGFEPTFPRGAKRLDLSPVPWDEDLPGELRVLGAQDLA